jgi:hypothetical protein
VRQVLPLAGILRMSANSERVKRAKLRRKLGIIIAPVQLPADIVESIVDAGILKPELRKDRPHAPLLLRRLCAGHSLRHRP